MLLFAQQIIYFYHKSDIFIYVILQDFDMVKILMFRFFTDKKSQEASDTKISNTVITIILALLIAVALYYFIVWRIGHAFLPQK